MASLFEKIFGTYSDRELKKINHLVDKIESLDGEMQKLTDQQLKKKTSEFKDRLNNGETLDDILPYTHSYQYEQYSFHYQITVQPDF